jgi:hypothetical protein
MKRIVPPIGTRFGRLVCIGPAECSGRWKFQCDCGSPIKETWHNPVRRGIVQSCGCLWKETVPGNNKRHGKTRSNIYRLWSMMLDRCRNPENARYAQYGGRGIYVCARWHVFANFYADMGDRPEGLTLNRIDNDGPYAPWNCEWATASSQARNKTNNKMLTLSGKTQSLAAWSEELGVKYNTLNTRVQRGWSDERVLTTPIRKVSAAWRSL